MSRRYRPGQNSRNLPEQPVYFANQQDDGDNEFIVHSSHDGHVDRFDVHQQESGEFTVHQGVEGCYFIDEDDNEFPVHQSGRSSRGATRASSSRTTRRSAPYPGGDYPVHSGGVKHSGDYSRDSSYQSALSRQSGKPQQSQEAYSRFSRDTGYSNRDKVVNYPTSVDDEFPVIETSGELPVYYPPQVHEEDEFQVHHNSPANYSSRISDDTEFPIHTGTPAKYRRLSAADDHNFSVRSSNIPKFGRGSSIDVELDEEDMEEQKSELMETEQISQRGPVAGNMVGLELFEDDTDYAELVRLCLDYKTDDVVDDVTDYKYPYKNADINFKQFYYDSLVKLCNAHLPTDLQARDISSGFRDGRALCKILQTLSPHSDIDIPVQLIHEHPKTYNERLRNTRRMLGVIFAYKTKESVEVTESRLHGYSDFITNGDECKTAFVLTMLFNDHLIAPVNHCGYTGAEALNVYFTRCGISFSRQHYMDHDSRNFLDLPENQQEIINTYAPFLAKDTEKIEMMDSETEKMKFFAKFFELHFGVPQILFADFDKFKNRGSLHLYNFLQLAWAAEFFISAQLNQIKRIDSKILINCPITYLNDRLKNYMEMEIRSKELNEHSFAFYADLQDWINKLKHFHESIGNDLAKNKETLKMVRKMITTCMVAKTRQFAIITRLTAILQSSVKVWNKDPALISDPKYHITNLHKMFQTILHLHRSIELKIKKKAKAKEFGCEYKNTFNRKYRMIKCWMDRWQMCMLDYHEDRYNVPRLNMRHKLLTKLQHEIESMKEELEQLHVLKDGLIETGQITLDDKFHLEKQCQEISQDFDTFVIDTQMAMTTVKELETEARDLDSMLCEEAVLMMNLDMQLHEFYNYFTYRPTCNSLSDVQLLSKYSVEARDRLYCVAVQLDALYSVSDDIEQLNSVQKVPANYYTCFKLKHIVEHWEKVLVSVAQMESWISKQEKIWTQLEGQFGKVLFDKLEESARFLRAHMAELIVPVNDVKKIRRRESQLTVLKNRVDHVSHKILNKLFSNIQKIFDLSKPLHERGIITPKVGALLHAADHCLTVVELLKEDVDTQLHLIKNRDGGEDDSIQDICDYYHKANKQVLLARDTLETLVKHEYDDDEEKRALIEENEFDTILQFSDVLDPYQRITCSMWLDVKHSPDYHEKTKKKYKYLVSVFSLLSDNKEYLTEAQLYNLLGRNYHLVDFCRHNFTEYFGEDANKERKAGVICYDYKRFVSNLLGKHQKLCVNPN